MPYNNLKISTQKAESIVLSLFNVQGIATELPGYIDLNFRIKVIGGDGYVLKISEIDENEVYIDFQQCLLQYIENKEAELITPKVCLSVNGEPVSEITDKAGNSRKVRLLSWIPGRIWSDVNPQSEDLLYSLGERCGALTKALQGFDHPLADRELVWDISQSLWTVRHLELFEGEERDVIVFFQKRFKTVQPAYGKLRKSVVHNDANDKNIVVSPTLVQPKVRAVIDYGDAIHTQIINDLAIACAYAVMGQNDPLQASSPLIKGYHSSFPLQECELEHLYVAIAMRLVISVVKSAINKIEETDNNYLLVSEKSAWKVLKKLYAIDSDYAHYTFRQACGYPGHPKEVKFKNWCALNTFTFSELFPSIAKNDLQYLDLSVSSKWIGNQGDINDLDLFQFKIDRLQSTAPDKIIAGGYLEPRSIYTSPAYDRIGNDGRESRSIHLGIDFWLPAQTPVHTLLDGEVVIAANDARDKGYGGLIVLRHILDDIECYTLYGHLTVGSATDKKIGDIVKKGECIALLGDCTENGNWAPHLHFQLMLSLLGHRNDFPGVAYPSQLPVWKSICPDPGLLFGFKGLSPVADIPDDELIRYRKLHLGKSLSLQYDTPVKMVRGAGQYLIDKYGKKYLDTVNNVAHVGHEHPEVVRAGCEQMALINTNSRYLHKNINTLAQELLETLPAELSVVHFVNSGSEANELAIRMVKANTLQRDIIVSEAGYHGNTNICIDISSYKFDGNGGSGAPEHTHIFPLPNAYRGKYRGKDSAAKYAGEIQKLIEDIQKKGRDVGALIIEPIISCGGQIELPEGFLAKAYKYIRDAGGLCISDEVQLGCGRLGKSFWGFQLHKVIPDIVTIGKPLGNGHPLAAVVCTQEVADRFANGMEYFNTFGGNPVSCAIGIEVLRTIKRESLQENALIVGEFLKTELKKLALLYPIIGDIRGQGLFLGIELVDADINPLAAQTDYMANRMKEHCILMSTDGIDNNVLKIKPPLVFTIENAKELLFYSQKILKEDFMQLV